MGDGLRFKLKNIVQRMRVGLVYDLFEDYPWAEGDPSDADAENEPVETVEAIAEAVRILGHKPV